MYLDSVSDAMTLVNNRERNQHVVVGADLQTRLGHCDIEVMPDKVGLFAEGPRGHKGDLAFDAFISDGGLVALNTI